MENLLEKSDYFELDEIQRIKQMNIEAQEGGIIENFRYSRPLTDQEIKVKNAQINQALAEIERLKEQVSDLNALKKDQTKIIQDNNKEVISKFTEKTGKVWKIINTENGYIETINQEGYIIEKSKIKSGTIKNMFNQSKSAM